MASTPSKTDIEPPSVSVFVRPLEVSVPVLDSPPLPPSNPPPPKTYVSTMTSRIETETSIKRWSTPQVKHEEGQPPGPEDHPETREGKKLEGNVKTITPSYKLGEDKPVHDIRLGTAGYLPSGTGDYKVSMRQEDYKQTVIDPKVRSNANMPLSSMKLPDARRALADDFPSEHSKRSQIKLEPLEQRRFKSVERRPVSTSSYLTESVNRHRDADKSILHPYLKAKEGDASKPWEKPNWPGPKKNADDEKMRELEIMKQKLETISKKAKVSSMYNLSILSPDEFGKTIVVGQPSPTLHDIGTLIKMRKERLEHSKQMRKTKSEDMLVQLPPKEDWSHSDLAHRQLRKEFHLSQYTERRSSWSQEVRPGPSKPEEQPQSVHLPVQVSVKVDEDKRKPRGPEEDYPERLMSPPPTKEPRSILKSERSQQRYDYRYSSDQQYQHQHYEEYREVRNGTRAPSERVEPPPPPPPPAAIQSHPPHHHHGPSKPTTAPPPPPAQPMRPRSTTFQDLPEEERYRIMQENLMKHRQHRPTTPKQHTANFNGPFFRLEEVTPGASGQPYRPPTTNGYSLNQMKSMSQSEMELEQHFHRNEEPHVVVWPPPNDKNRPRSQSVMSKSMMDPERIEELRRQQALEREAMKRHDDEKMKSMAKQIRAMQIQQERLYEQQHGVTSPVPMMPMGHEDPNAYMTDMDEEAPGPQPQNMRIFETRPISSMSENVDMPTWKRTYVVDRPQEVAKNEILTSDELLQREQYEVDILKRREAFVEKPDMAPELQRTGKRWQPPPDKPYVWPTLRRPISVEPHLTSPIDFPPGPPQEEDEYKWAPVVNDPGYRRERKNFTPTHSPPPSPRRGMNTLDEVNKRQTKYVVQPSSDGSHRPKPAFRKERHPPHGGFYPHAPNAIKVVKRRAASVQNLNSPNMEHEDIEVIAHRNYLRVDPVYQQHPPSRSASAVDHRLRRDSSHHSSHHELSGINEWEKIYELPPHSSTIVGKDVPRNIDVRRRLNQFEGSIQNLAERKHLVRATSVESSNSQPFPPPDYDLTLPTTKTSDRHQVSRRNSVASGHHETPRRERQHSRSHSRAPSSILLSPTPRGDTPGAQRARAHIARSTAASPTPPSYDRARVYQPPALPPGYRLADPPPDMRAISPQPGHTKRMVRTVQDSTRRIASTPQTSRAPSRSTSAAKEPPKTDDLDQLGRRTAELEERSRAHRSSYKLYDSEIHKTAPAPMPSGLKDQVNELLASRASLNTVEREHDRSGYATDVSTATWQFSTHSFSPRSVVSMNGARDDILKSRVPADLESVTSSARTAPAAFRVIGSSLDDKPRSIMKRRELESREQMMYPANQQLVQSYQRSSSNVAKPTVTETVQRFEETRRTEEVERRVQRKERRERRSRHHSSSRHGGGWGHDAYIQEQRRMASLPRQIVYQQANRAMTADETDQLVREAYEAADEARRHGTRVRSNSLSRALPNTQEAYYRQTTTKRDRDFSGSRYEDEAFGRGLAHARYGSLSDSLRRGELKYIPNGDVRESGHFGNSRNVHKSYSTRDVFNNDYDRRSVSSQRRGSQQVSPFVEFPPTLPRRGDRDNYRPISKSRSYADWDDQGRAGFGGAVRRYDDDMTRLEAEFRDSLLMPMPLGNMNERDHRTENIPGGYETFDKNKKAQTGRRLGREGQPVDYHESSQEYNYKREQELDRRR